MKIFKHILDEYFERLDGDFSAVCNELFPEKKRTDGDIVCDVFDVDKRKLDDNVDQMITTLKNIKRLKASKK